MKSINLIPLLLLALVACTKKSEEHNLDALKQQRTELTKQLSDLETKIKTIEKASGKREVRYKTAFVQVQSLQPEVFKHYIEVQGRVTSDQNLTITPKTAGEITKLYVHKGSTVKKGQILASLDVETLIKSRNELKTGLDFATQVYEKQKALWDQKVGTEIQYLQAKNNKEGLESKLATLNQQISYGNVVAPSNGVIEEVYPREGEGVSPGMPMFRLVGNGDFKIIADVSEAYSSKISVGNEAEVFFPDMNKTLKTTVKVVGDEINAVNRSFYVELYLPNTFPGIKGNMIAYVKVKDYEKKNSLAIPVGVVQKSTEGTYVFVSKGSKAAKKTVTTGQTYKGISEVLSGLTKGDSVVTAGYLDLIEGQPLKF